MRVRSLHKASTTNLF